MPFLTEYNAEAKWAFTSIKKVKKLEIKFVHCLLVKSLCHECI